jgi:hypothetical protein
MVQSVFNVNLFSSKDVQYLGTNLPFNRRHPKAYKYGTVIKGYNGLGTQNKPRAQRNQWLLPNNTPNLFCHNTPQP